MRVLITGAAGFFGLALTRAFARAGEAVLAVDRLPPDQFHPRPDTPADHLTYLRCDVADRQAVLALLGTEVEAVVHAAALTPTAEQQVEDPEGIIDVNLGGTVNMLAFARRSPRCRRLVYISSAGVFDQSRDAVLREADADGGTSLYGAAKLAAEALFTRYGAIFGIGVAAVRPTSLYGPGEQPRPTRPNVTQIWSLVDAARSGRPVRVEGPEARCDWLHVDDAAEAVLQLITAQSVPAGVFNLSSGRIAPFREVVDAVAAVLPLDLGPSAELLVDGGPDRAAIIANDRIRAAIDWTPRSLRDGIEQYVRTLEGQPTEAPEEVVGT